jgi:DNA-binding transcriptional MocR family regulator
VAWLEATMDDTEASTAAGRAGVRAEAMRNYYAGGIGRPGLVLGYAGFGPHQINAAMRRLAEALRSLPRRGVRYG